MTAANLRDLVRGRRGRPAARGEIRNEEYFDLALELRIQSSKGSHSSPRLQVSPAAQSLAAQTHGQGAEAD